MHACLCVYRIIWKKKFGTRVKDFYNRFVQNLQANTSFEYQKKIKRKEKSVNAVAVLQNKWHIHSFDK